MQISLKILNLNSNNDVQKLRSIISNVEGIIACEINRNKKELNIVFDDTAINESEIIAEIENEGFSAL